MNKTTKAPATNNCLYQVEIVDSFTPAYKCLQTEEEYQTFLNEQPSGISIFFGIIGLFIVMVVIVKFILKIIENL